MQVQEAHRRYFLTSIASSKMQVKNVISPLDLIKLSNANQISFVQVGAHGLAGWLKKPRATQDVDFVIGDKHLKKATQIIVAEYPQLEPVDLPVVIRMKERDSEEVLIDLMKTRDLYQMAFKYTRELQEEQLTYRVPSLEMAMAMKFAAMVSPNRQQIKKFQDAHDFGQMLFSNPDFDRDILQSLADTVYNGGGAEVLEIVRKLLAGERIEL